MKGRSLGTGVQIKATPKILHLSSFFCIRGEGFYHG
ncbi:MAG: hypothetical protein DID90_2727552503 [Candidatus Nitrotoga sp. LAW]|nr:MAG: hypothetical protein DID90_2727552503 [Candidatus Nitrotoga sp. LAW]